MTPEATLDAIESVLQAYLIVMRDVHPPEFTKGQQYKGPWPPEGHHDQTLMDVAREPAQLVLGKSVTILLLSAVDPAEHRARIKLIKAAVGRAQYVMFDWLIRRRDDQVGAYYKSQGLQTVLMEDLPDIPALVREVGEIFFGYPRV